MKFIYLIFFFLILSCSTVKKVYVCGDHPCIDKKELNEYFSKNLTIEIKSQQNKKNKVIDLAKLNTVPLDKKKNDNINYKKINKMKKKEEKIKSKVEQKRLLNERKIKEKELKIQAKEKAKIAKMSKFNDKNKKNTNNQTNNNRKKLISVNNKKLIQEKTNTVKLSKNNISINTQKKNKTKSICDDVKNCDIDQITDMLIRKGKNKPFPDLSLN
jgi:hypothetical protein